MPAPHYGTRSEADEYHAVRANASWGSASEADRDAALVRASGYLDGRYRSRFPGRKAGGRTQALEWPRLNATDGAGEAIADDEVPAEVLSATFEAALRELRSPGSLVPDFTAGQVVTSKRVKAGPVETETAFGSVDSAAEARPIIGVIDDLLAGLLVTPRSRTVSTSFLARA